LEEGFEVITAKNIEEALLTLKGVKPDLLILDLSEKATREESFDKLKKKYPDIPWVGHSAYVECPCEFKKWINYYISKSPEIGVGKEPLNKVLLGFQSVSFLAMGSNIF